MLCVYSHVRCGFCKKIKNRKPSGWKRSYFGREAKKTRAHTKWLWAWTPNWRFMGGDVDSSYLYFSLLISFCVTICVKVAKKYMPQKSIAENRVWTSAEKGKMRSNSKNQLLLYRLKRKPSFLDFWHRRWLDSLFRKPSTVYRATLVLMICTPTYGASNIGQYRPNDSFAVKLSRYRATPRIHSDLVYMLRLIITRYLVCS